MTFAVDDYRALVQLLLDHPEWRAELRPLILGEEMAALPEGLSALRVTVADLATEVAQLRLAVQQLTSVVAGLSTRTSRLEGNTLEVRYYNHVGAWFGKWLRHPVAVSPEHLDLLEAAEAEGRISEEQIDQLRWSDLLIRGNAKPSLGSGETILAVEVSQTIDDHDVERAAARAEILRSVGYQAFGVAGGELLSGSAAELAARVGVIIDLRAANR
jgi:hypothetical protein